MINYYYYFYIIVLSLISLVALGYFLISYFFGFPPDRNNIILSMATKRTAVLWFQRILALVGVGILLVAYFWIDLPVLRDIPAYLSDNYSITEGRVIKIWEGSSSFAIVEDVTERPIEFLQIRGTSYVDIGDHVEVTYLKHCKMGSLLAVNSDKVPIHQHSEKRFLVLLDILTNVLLICYILMLVGKIKTPRRKKYSAKVYHGIYIRFLFVMEGFLLLGALIILIAAGGGYNEGMSIAWTCLVMIYFTLPWVLFALTQQQIVIDGGKLTYCNFNRKYEGKIEDIIRLELKDKKQMLVTMKDGTELTVNDMEIFKNQEFYYRLQRELPEAVSGGNGNPAVVENEGGKRDAD